MRDSNIKFRMKTSHCFLSKLSEITYKIHQISNENNKGNKLLNTVCYKNTWFPVAERSSTSKKRRSSASVPSDIFSYSDSDFTPYQALTSDDRQD